MERKNSDFTFGYYPLIAFSETVKCLLCLLFVPFSFHHSPGENQNLVDRRTLFYITLLCPTFFPNANIHYHSLQSSFFFSSFTFLFLIHRIYLTFFTISFYIVPLFSIGGHRLPKGTSLTLVVVAAWPLRSSRSRVPSAGRGPCPAAHGYQAR